MAEDTAFELPNQELFGQLSKGSEVEVLYGTQWYLSKVLQVNEAKCQIFIHYKGWNSRHDQWVLVGDGVKLPGADASMSSSPTKTSSCNNTQSSITEITESPQSVTEYQPGTMLLGEWKDGYQYVCFVQSSNANGSVNVKFYDGSRGSLIRAKLSPVTDIAIKEYEQWKYEESQIKDYEKRTGKRVKSFEQLVKILAVNNSSTPTKDASSALKNFKSKDEFITGDVLKEPSTASLDSLDTTSISCPESGKFQCEQPNCGKSFRKLTLLLHHTKHYHKNSDLMDEQVSKSCSADVLAKQLKERRSLGTNIVARKRKVDVQEAFTSPETGGTGKKKLRSLSNSLSSSPVSKKKMTTSKKDEVPAADENLAGTTCKTTSPAVDSVHAKNDAVTDEEVDVFVVEGQAPETLEPKSDTKLMDTQSSMTEEQILASDVSNCDNETEKIMQPSSSNLELETMRFASKQKSQQKNKPKLKLTGGSKYYCKLCGGSFTSGKTYHKHMAIHGRPSIDKEKATPKIDVQIAAETEPKKVKTTKIIGGVSTAESHLGKDFTCPVCSQKFLTEESLEVHQKVRIHFVVKNNSKDDRHELESSLKEKHESKTMTNIGITHKNENSSVGLVLEDLKFKSPLKNHSPKKKSRRLKLLNSLKKPKLPKFSGEGPKIKIRCNFGTKDEKKNDSDEQIGTVPISQTEPAFVPVFLDPPSTDETNEGPTPNLNMAIYQSESQNVPIMNDDGEGKMYTGKMYEKAHSLACTYPGCDKSFRKQSFLDLHVKHYHSSKKSGTIKETSNQNNAANTNRASITAKPNTKKTSASVAPKNKSKASVTKKLSNEPKRIVSKISSPSASNNTKSAALKLNEESAIKKTPVKESYNDILNDSLTAKAETSPLSSDNEENFAEKLTVKSVHDSPSQQGLKKVFKLNFMPLSSETRNESAEPLKIETSKKAHKFKRAIIEDSECGSVASVDSEGWSGETIKCVCDFVEVFGTMVQCSFCNVWLHAECLDVNENSLPEEYECPYCEVKRRVRKSEVHSDWFSLSLPDDPLGSGCPSEPTIQQTAPWIVATDQLSHDLHQLQSTIETFEALYEVMQNPGHVQYPQLVLRFQNDLQTFDSQSNKLEYSDLDPNVVKLIMELEESSSRLIQPEELSPVGISFKNIASDPVDDPTNLDSSLEIDESRDCSENDDKNEQPIITWLSPEKMDLESLDNTSSGNIDNDSAKHDENSAEKSELNQEITNMDASNELEANATNGSEGKTSSESGSRENEAMRRSVETPVITKAARMDLIDFDPSAPPKNILEMMNRLLFQLETRMDHLENLFEKLESGYVNCIQAFPALKCQYKFYEGSGDNFRNEMRRLSNDLFLITQLNKIAT